MTGCEYWPNGVQCGREVVETLVYLNPNINSQVHADGSIRCCASCLSRHHAEHLTGEQRP